MKLEDLLEVARGDRPAETVLTNVRLVNVFTGEVLETGIALAGGLVAGIGPDYEGAETVDLGGRYVAPGMIDAHVHIESSMVRPAEFARAVVPAGVTTVVTDPHEIANVSGLAGIRYMLRDSEGVPLEVFVNASSCVPATDLATAGAELGAEELASLLSEPRVLGLAEVMNFPGVIYGDPGVLAKLRAFEGRVLDGHAPGLSGTPTPRPGSRPTTRRPPSRRRSRSSGSASRSSCARRPTPTTCATCWIWSTPGPSRRSASPPTTGCRRISSTRARSTTWSGWR